MTDPRDRFIRESALGQLAIKTRERVDPLVTAAYLDDERMIRIETQDFLAACHRLATAEWFPKFGELLEACRTVARERREREDNAQAKRIAAYAEIPPVSQEEARAILGRVFQRIGYNPKHGFGKPITGDRNRDQDEQVSRGELTPEHGPQGHRRDA